jgi:protein-tyrosine phosphatase
MAPVVALTAISRGLRQPAVIEIHAHVLPGIDDGPRNLEESLALLSAFVADGVTHVVATPHVHQQVFPLNNRSFNELALQEFKQAIAAHDLAISLSVAGEVRLDEQVIELFERGELPFLGRSAGLHYLLLELPDGQIPVGTDKLIAWLRERKIQPVIAHPERNRVVRDTPQRGLELVQMGCLLQVTAGALLGGFGQRVQTAAAFLVQQQAVAAIASDAHNLAARSPCMGAAYQWLTEHHGESTAIELTRTRPAQLCAVD